VVIKIKNMQQQKIEFRKERDFGSVLGDSLKFLKQNFKSFFASIILIVGPFILIMGFGYGYMQTAMMDTSYANAGNPGSVFNAQYFMSIGITVFCGLLANILLSAVVYNYMIIYNEKPVGESITVSEVGKKVWAGFGALTISSLTFIFCIAIAIAAIAIICIGIISIMGTLGGVLVFLAIFTLFVIYIPVVSYFIPAAFFVVVRDGVFIFPAMGKVRNYLKGNFWWTWLIMIVTLISLGILQGLFNLPATIMLMVRMFSKLQPTGESDNNILLIAFYTFGMFFTYCTTSISHLIAALNFMSHEEKHNGEGLMSRIEEIA